MADDLDFRFTPMYESESALLKEATQGLKELNQYIKSPQKLDIEQFPVYEMYNEKFGISTAEHLKGFVMTQKEVLKKRNQ